MSQQAMLMIFYGDSFIQGRKARKASFETLGIQIILYQFAKTIN